MTVIKLKEDPGVKASGRFTSAGGAFRGDSDIVIDFSEARRVDLSIAQVLIAAGKEARAMSKSLRMRRFGDGAPAVAICGLSR